MGNHLGPCCAACPLYLCMACVKPYCYDHGARARCCEEGYLDFLEQKALYDRLYKQHKA